MDLICTHKRKPMEQCCCKETVSGIWTAKLPENVRTAIANESLGGGNLPKVLQIANAVYRASSATSTVASTAVTPAESTETAGTLPVEAFQRGRGRGRGRFGRGRGGWSQRGRGAAQQGQNKDQKKTTHPDNPPAGCCKQHQKWGKSAYYCVQPSSCPWSQITAPPVEEKD